MRKDIKVLYMSGYTDDSAIRQGVSWSRVLISFKNHSLPIRSRARFGMCLTIEQGHPPFPSPFGAANLQVNF